MLKDAAGSFHLSQAHAQAADLHGRSGEAQGFFFVFFFFFKTRSLLNDTAGGTQLFGVLALIVCKGQTAVQVDVGRCSAACYRGSMCAAHSSHTLVGGAESEMQGRALVSCVRLACQV